MKNKNLALFLIGFSIIIVLAGTFWLGAYYSCKTGGGTLVGNIMLPQCNKIDIVKVCEYEGKKYRYDNTPEINRTLINI